MHKSEDHWTVVPHVLPTQCLKNKCHGSFLWSPETTSDSTDFSNMMESVLASTSACFLRTQRCLLSGLIDLYKFSFIRWP